MKTHRNKERNEPRSADSKSAGPKVAQRFVDNRPIVAVQQTLQLMADQAVLGRQPLQRVENSTGMPDALKSGIENLSGYSLDPVKVHYNSPKPAAVQAHAYAQGSNIHLGPGQEKHLPHEAWHVVQQMQGRVQPTTEVNGQAVNDNGGLEREADVMGSKALQLKVDVHKDLKKATISAASMQLRGVGGTKIGFEKRTNEEHQDRINAGMALLREAWTEARNRRSAEKDRISRDMALYNQAMKDDDREEIKRLEEENDRRNRPGLYQNLEQSEHNLAVQTQDNQKLQGLLFGGSGIPYRESALSPLVLDGRARQSNLRGIRDGLKGQFAQQPMNRGLSQVYFDKLASQLKDESDLLLETAYFLNGSLSVEEDVIIFQDRIGRLAIADLRKGLDAYTDPEVIESEVVKRDIYRKKGLEDLSTGDKSPKEYVKDSRGVMTRRYAYVEKNYYQMMEFFMVGHMTGRFQQYMMAAGERKPGIHTFTTDMIKNVPDPSLPKQQRMTDTQVAVAHQMYGSLPEQRGVSLTSTPKVGVTYANTGGNFRTDDGFKLKIDLARVPDDILFLNHYAEGGVSSSNPKDYSTNQSHKSIPYNYKYEESASHARELFLEEIQPAWIVEIEHHAKGGFEPKDGEKQIIRENETLDLIEAAKRAFGGAEYEQGFEAGLIKGPAEESLKNNKDYKKGKGTGEMVISGFEKGREVAKIKGISNHMLAFKETMEDPGIQDKMSPFHIGYVQARTGQPMLKSLVEFRLLMNNKIEFKSAAHIKGTVSLFQDATSLIIKSLVPGQMDGFKSVIINIPFDELLPLRYEKEVEKDYVDFTIYKRSGEYNIYLQQSEADNFIQSLNTSVKRYNQGASVNDTEMGGSHTLMLDAANLNLERQSKKQMGGVLLKKYQIPLSSITKIGFSKDEHNIEVTIDHNGGTYSMSLAILAAARVREILLKNGLSATIVGNLPED